MSNNTTAFNLSSFNLSTPTSVYQLPSQYSLYQYVLAPALIIYFGLFVMLNNHYVFKPKVQKYLAASSIQSVALQQFIIDFLSNLPILTFLFNEISLLNMDNGISVAMYSDLYWSGICMSILAYRRRLSKFDTPTLIFVKNVVFLCIAYGIISFHYIFGVYLVSLGLSLFGIYFLNLIVNANEEKFIKFINNIFNLKVLEQGEQVRLKILQVYPHQNLMSTPEYLSKHFPVNLYQINNKVKEFSKPLKQIKLKTKASVTEKLLKICLAVHLSLEKMDQKCKKDVRIYYGGQNGTVSQKTKRLEFEVKPTLQESQEAFIEIKNEVQNQIEPQSSVIFYLFPVKLFEASKVISVVFSIFISLSFGFCLSIVLQITQTIRFGQYFQFLYAILLLPILPNASKTEYLNNMALSSLWKYCLAGLFLSIYCFGSMRFLTQIRILLLAGRTTTFFSIWVSLKYLKSWLLQFYLYLPKLLSIKSFSSSLLYFWLMLASFIKRSRHDFRVKDVNFIFAFCLINWNVQYYLIIIFMSQIESPRSTKNSSSEKQEPQFQTPKKKSIMLQIDQPKTQKKVKSITKITQKQTTNIIFPMLMFLWIVLAIGVIYFTARSKMLKFESEVKKMISDCDKDYTKNNCETPLKGIVNYCKQKQICKNSSFQEIYAQKINFAEMAGEMIYEFSNSSGATGLLVGIILIWLCLKNKGKSKSIVSMEFYE